MLLVNLLTKLKKIKNKDILIDIYTLLQKDANRRIINLPPILYHNIKKNIDVPNFTKEERQVREIVLSFLVDAERETSKKIINLTNFMWNKLSQKYKVIKSYKTKVKIVRNDLYEYTKNTFPNKYKSIINYGDVELLSTVSTTKLTDKLTRVILNVSNKTRKKVFNELQIKGKFVKENPFANFYAKRIRKFTKDVSINLQSNIKDNIITSLKYGESRQQLVKRIRKIYKKPILVKVAPLKDKAGNILRAGYSYSMSNKVWANSIASTEVSFATNNSRLQEMKTSRVIAKVRWIVTSANPCGFCGQMDGKEMTFDEATSLIPYHVNCYCTWQVAKYKTYLQPLPIADEYANQVYANPEGIGIMEMMKMPPATLAKFTSLLDSDKTVAAQMLLTKFHGGGMKSLSEAHSIETNLKLIAKNLSPKELRINFDKLYDKSNLNQKAFKGIKKVRIKEGSFWKLKDQDISSFYKEGELTIINDPAILAQAITKLQTNKIFTKDEISEIQRILKINLKVQKFYSKDDLNDVLKVIEKTASFMTSKEGQLIVLNNFGESIYSSFLKIFKRLTPVPKTIIKSKIILPKAILNEADVLKNLDTQKALKKLEELYKANPTEDVNKYRYIFMKEFSNIDYDYAQVMLKVWKVSTLDDYRTLVLRRVTLPNNSFLRKDFSKILKERKLLPNKFNDIKNYFNDIYNIKIQKAIWLEKIYTQKILELQGKKFITCYRGIRGDWAKKLYDQAKIVGKNKEIEYIPRHLFSVSLKEETADFFTKDYKIAELILKYNIPIKNIYTNGGWGIWLKEQENIIMGTDKVKGIVINYAKE